MRTRLQVHLGKWHSVHLVRKGKDAVLQLDDNMHVGTRSAGASQMLDLKSKFFIGGVPDKSSINKQALKDIDLQHQFFGCISSLEVRYHVNLLTSLDYWVMHPWGGG